MFCFPLAHCCKQITFLSHSQICFIDAILPNLLVAYAWKYVFVDAYASTLHISSTTFYCCGSYFLFSNNRGVNDILRSLREKILSLV